MPIFIINMNVGFIISLLLSTEKSTKALLFFLLNFYYYKILLENIWNLTQNILNLPLVSINCYTTQGKLYADFMKLESESAKYLLEEGMMLGTQPMPTIL